MSAKNYIEFSDELQTAANCDPELNNRQRQLLTKAAKIVEEYYQALELIEKMNALFVPKILTLKTEINGN